MPLVTQQMKQYQKALYAANKANSPQSKAALGFATANLARALEPFGVNLNSLGTVQGATNAPAQENQGQ